LNYIPSFRGLRKECDEFLAAPARPAAS